LYKEIKSDPLGVFKCSEKQMINKTKN